MSQEMVSAGDRFGITGLAYALKNDIGNADNYLKELTVRSATPDGFRVSAYLLFIYTALGEKEKAFDWISKAIENKSTLLLIYFVDPLVNSLKADPRYGQFQKQIFPDISLPLITRIDTN